MTREQRLAEARRRVAVAERLGRFDSRPCTFDAEGFNGWYDAVFPSQSYEQDRQMVKDADRRGAQGGGTR